MKYLNYVYLFYIIIAHIILFYYLFAPKLIHKTNTNAMINVNNKYYYYGENDFCRSGLDVSENILKVLNISNAHSIQLFLVELNRLAKYASEQQLNTLKEHIFFDSGFNVSYINANEISFGFFDHSANESQFRYFLEELKLNNFQCKTIGSKNELNFDNSTLDVSDEMRKRCSKGNTIIHLIRFTRRHDFYWFVEQTNALIFTGNYTQNNNKNDHTFLSAFDVFNLTRCYINDMHWYLPRDFTYFMAQTKASRYVSCDLNGSKQFHEKHPNLTRFDDSLKIKAKKLIISLKRIMEKEVKQFWILGGTLLGWYRQCGLFSYTNDLDFATWQRYADQQFTERLRNNSHNLFMKFIFGFPDEAYEMAFTFDGFKADLFYNYVFNASQQYAVSTHANWLFKYSYYYHPKYEICSGELFGIRVNVPCNPRDIIIDTYGEKWRNPIEGWDWYNSPFNKGIDIFWNEERKHKAFQSF